LMTGVWKDLFAKFGAGNYRIRKENDASDDTLKDRIDGAGGTGDSFDGSDEGSQLPP